MTAAQGVQVWDTETGKLLLTLHGHTGSVVAAQFSPDGTRLLTAGQVDDNQFLAATRPEGAMVSLRVVEYDTRPVNRAFRPPPEPAPPPRVTPAGGRLP
ncbi:MAG: hypothetical protein K2P78_06245 [Gemmataceae bacterium]|nr:hypothetical protein [Gemmataceae bacterium]